MDWRTGAILIAPVPRYDGSYTFYLYKHFYVAGYFHVIVYGRAFKGCVGLHKYAQLTMNHVSYHF